MEIYKNLPKIDIGPVAAMGDCYYDGILDAHNDKYFITVDDEIDHPCNNSECDSSRCYESIYLVYEMNAILKYLFKSSFDILKIRRFVEGSFEPIGFCLEGDLDRSGQINE